MNSMVSRLSSSQRGGAPEWRTGTQDALLDRLVAISRDSALEEMASGISHELNQPLGAIVTFAQTGERILCRPEASIADAREVFQLISQQALAAAEGIRRIRHLFNRDALSRTQCAMDEVVGELKGVLSLFANNLGVQLRFDYGRELPPVNIDRLRLQHVLFTLVQNALEASAASSNDEPLVVISVQGNRYELEVSITDNGTGIPPEHHSHLFHPFFTTKEAGTGLGLASARAIVESHEGIIGFDVQSRASTRFWFRIPAAPQIQASAPI
jgi:C4-dicarboxylate-specific signal transduction histidine kinase